MSQIKSRTTRVTLDFALCSLNSCIYCNKQNPLCIPRFISTCFSAIQYTMEHSHTFNLVCCAIFSLFCQLRFATLIMGQQQSFILYQLQSSAERKWRKVKMLCYLFDLNKNKSSFIISIFV